MAGQSDWRPSAGAPVPGSRLAGYVLEEQIGAGGMAIVFRARDEMLGRLAAVKVITPTMAGDAEFRARFLRESRAIATVEQAHIIPVYGAGEVDGVLYIATRYVAGGDLVDLVRQAGGALPPDRAAGLIAQVASALDAAHAAGLVHRDVKPANILIDVGPGHTEHAFLSDFGLSKGTSSVSGLTATGQFLGTPDYCAPEQIRGGAMDGRLDQYALACVAFALLTGELPFRRGDAMATLFAHVHDPVPTASRSRAGLSPAIDSVLARGMAKEPAERYASCGAFATALQGALAPGTVMAVLDPDSPWRQPTKLAEPPSAPGAGPQASGYQTPGNQLSGNQLSGNQAPRTQVSGNPGGNPGGGQGTGLQPAGAASDRPFSPSHPANPGYPASASPPARPVQPAGWGSAGLSPAPARRLQSGGQSGLPERRSPSPSWLGQVEWRPILIGVGVAMLLVVMLVVQQVWHVWG